MPLVSRVTPGGGPLYGDTRIAVAGAGLTGGTDYRCVFDGAFVAAAYNASDGTVGCVAPPHNVTGGSLARVGVGLSLNGVEPSTGVPGAEFEFPCPCCSRLTPFSAPQTPQLTTESQQPCLERVCCLGET